MDLGDKLTFVSHSILMRTGILHFPGNDLASHGLGRDHLCCVGWAEVAPSGLRLDRAHHSLLSGKWMFFGYLIQTWRNWKFRTLTGLKLSFCCKISNSERALRPRPTPRRRVNLLSRFNKVKIRLPTSPSVESNLMKSLNQETSNGYRCVDPKYLHKIDYFWFHIWFRNLWSSRFVFQAVCDQTGHFNWNHP